MISIDCAFNVFAYIEGKMHTTYFEHVSLVVMVILICSFSGHTWDKWYFFTIVRKIEIDVSSVPLVGYSGI